MALDLYIGATPNGWKISIMIEELREAGVDLPETRIHMVNLGAGEQFTPAFKTPVILRRPLTACCSHGP